MASNSGLNLDLEESRPAALGVGKRPVAAGRGSGGLEVAIAPGQPDQSILLHRMKSTEPGVMMPELGRSVVHDEGVARIADYIRRLRPSGAGRPNAALHTKRRDRRIVWRSDRGM